MVQCNPVLPPSGGFPELLVSRVEVKKVRKKLKLVIKGELTDDLIEDIKKQFPDPTRIEELLRKQQGSKKDEQAEEDQETTYRVARCLCLSP